MLRQRKTCSTQQLRPDCFDLSRFVGIPFKIGGRDFSGCDCWGLVCLFYENILNVKLDPYEGCYVDAEDLEGIGKILEWEQKNWRKICLQSAQFGDVLLLSTRFVCHVGIFLDRARMLHSAPGKDSCIERLSSAIWASRIVGVYRLAS